MPSERWLPRSFLLLLAALLALAAWQWRNGPPVAADMLALLPAGSGDELVQQAEQRMQEPLNRDLLVLISHPETEQAVALTQAVAEQWQQQRLFAQLRWHLDDDLAALRQQLLDSRLALLPEAERQRLIKQPADFIQKRAAELFDPFAANLLPIEQDWLGLASRIQQAGSLNGRVQVDLASATLQASAHGQTWVLLHGRSQGAAFDMHSAPQIAAALAAARQQVTAAGGQLLATGGLLHAAAGQQRAMGEVGLLGGAAVLGVIALLLFALRRARALLALLPMAVALLTGVTACVLVFGQINALTLVLGTSLIGVASDYPLHYLSKRWGDRPWQSWQALRSIRPGLSLALATNLIGYLALAFTPFPALSQIALFSASGLLAAYLCTLCLLPVLFAGVPLRPAASLLKLAEALLEKRRQLLARTGSWPLLLALLLFSAAGLWQVQTQNDLRQWLGQEPQLLTEARQIAELTGQQPTSQFYLVRAANEQQLLQRQQALSQRLDQLVHGGELQGYRALSQLFSPADSQPLREALNRLPAHWQPLLDLGIPQAALQAELEHLLALSGPTIEQVLAGPLGEAWQPLWLGRTSAGVAAMVSLQGNAPAIALQQAAAGLDGVQLVDRPGELNQLFAATQLSAAQLKLIACAAMVLLLCLPFGLVGALRVVGLPLLAALAALASLGWLGQPLTLFSLFGLLLITALGVDYAILMREAVGGAAVSLLGVLLAGSTSWLAFGLLLFSATPAIANFGLAISLGLLFSFALAPWAMHREKVQPC